MATPVPMLHDDDVDDAVVATANALLQVDRAAIDAVHEVRDLASARVWRGVFTCFEDDEEADALRCLRWLQQTVDANQAQARVPRLDRDPELLVMAARHGWLEVLRFLRVECRIDGGVQRAMDKAAQYGHLHVLQYLCDTSESRCSYEAMDEAASQGHLAVVRFLYETVGMREMSWAQRLAAAAGHVDVLQFFHDAGVAEWSTDILRHAVHFGRVSVVRWLRETRPAVAFEPTILDSLSPSCATLEMAQYLHDHAMGGATTDAMDHAAAAGALDAVRFLHEHRREGCTAAAMDRAAAGGHVDVVAFLHHSRTEGCTTLAMDEAAMRGHLEVVRFLHAHRHEGCTAAALEDAVREGHLEVVRFLVHERREPVTQKAVAVAASYGHVEILRELLADDAPSSSSSSISVVEVFTPSFVRTLVQSVDVLRFVHERLQVELPPRALVAAVDTTAPSIDVVAYLLSHVDMPQHQRYVVAALCVAAERGSIHVLDAIERVMPLNEDVGRQSSDPRRPRELATWPSCSACTSERARAGHPQRWTRLLAPATWRSSGSCTSSGARAARRAPWTTPRPTATCASSSSCTASAQRAARPTPSTAPRPTASPTSSRSFGGAAPRDTRPARWTPRTSDATTRCWRCCPTTACLVDPAARCRQ
ncbi:hypothetical protein PINS_up019888 [Pythium insidiosum]|nr:hypothetical protein PINS_up019888 [Pythium insidiosum]